MVRPRGRCGAGATVITCRTPALGVLATDAVLNGAVLPADGGSSLLCHPVMAMAAILCDAANGAFRM